MLWNIIIIAYLLFAFLALFLLKRKGYQLSYRVLFGFLLGLIAGVLLKYIIYSQIEFFLIGALYFTGHAYLALLKMLVIPLILTSIMHAVLNLGFSKTVNLQRMSIATCFMLLGMTAVSSLIGIIIAYWMKLGEGLQLPSLAIHPKSTYTGLVDTLLAMIPSNPVAVMTQENTIAVVIFSVLFAFAARTLDQSDHDKMETFKVLISSLFAIVKKLAVLVLSFTPFGVFALMSLLIHEQGIIIFKTMINFLGAMYLSMAIVLVMHFMILVVTRRKPKNYFRHVFTPLFVAFTTRSSFGTLPVTEETLREKFKVNQVTATFVPSIGATIGMNACAGVFPAVLAVMTLIILKQPLTLNLVFMIMFINMIASLGISGIPGTAYIAATVTLTSLNLPYTIVALVQGIDPIVDMGRTATNVHGVLTTALVVDPKNKQIE